MRFRIVKKKNKIRLVKRRAKLPRCAICKKQLSGVFRGKANELRNLAKTKKRPERRYGGVLCSKCSREKIRMEVRQNV